MHNYVTMHVDRTRADDGFQFVAEAAHQQHSFISDVLQMTYLLAVGYRVYIANPAPSEPVLLRIRVDASSARHLLCTNIRPFSCNTPHT